MDALLSLLSSFANQLQSPTLAFLIGGMLLAACGSKLAIPDAVYRFIIFMLLMKVGLNGGIEIRNADLAQLALPAVFAVVIGCVAVLLGLVTLGKLPNVKREDALATSGLFGAVSASTLAAAMVALDEAEITYEAWAPALYPFMDIPALILAIVLAKLAGKGKSGSKQNQLTAKQIIVDSLRSSALSALLLGMLIGFVVQPVELYEGFYELLFRGFLSILMLIMGMEAWSRLSELRQVAQWFAAYAALAPIVHGLIAFGLGYIAHITVGFSPGGVIILSIIAASNSDISGPPTLRAGIPSANPSAYIAASTSVGTPIAIAVCIPLFIALAEVVFPA
ncbi:sodium-dependent bicarbonate transport family permease [Aurantiacibacter sediminis]|uniref:Sodium-dependent bicarbonate transport family permease n=1 Tax=Aurantiacibacter sediminis TaxID=2793064 RepID=A0ABS0N6H3_9SPHN|nr:sodium-dependent bicarbonate transport family permease [Aurantiacibacter sediminis]MBH5323414.1 sodium-dependent bicarbonate transport family permease [Aurantiacibacter sediminis]